MDAVIRWFQLPGSTTVAALFRIGCALLLWARYARELHPFAHVEQPQWLLLAALFYPLTLLMAVGLWSRVSTGLVALLTLTMYYGFGELQGYNDWTHHHTYALMATTVCTALLPNGRSLSLDRWLELRRAQREGREPQPATGDSWALRLIAWQVSMIYLWGAIDKTYWGYVRGDRLEQIIGFYYLGNDFPEGPWLGLSSAAAGSISLLLEYALALLPWFVRTRTPILVAGLLFHAVIYWTMPVGTFSLTMALMYLAFYRPDEVDDFVRRLLPEGA